VVDRDGAQPIKTGKTRVILDHCTAVGVPMILVTDTARRGGCATRLPWIRPTDDRPGTFTSQATVLILLEELTIAVAAQDRDRALDHSERINQLREELNGYSLATKGLLTLPKAKRKPRRRG